VCEKRVLRRIFGPKRDEVKGELRKQHNEELNDLYFTPDIIRIMKSRIMRWAGYVVRVGDRRVAYSVLFGKPVGKKHLEDLGVDGRILLNWIFRKWYGKHELD